MAMLHNDSIMESFHIKLIAEPVSSIFAKVLEFLIITDFIGQLLALGKSM